MDISSQEPPLFPDYPSVSTSPAQLCVGDVHRKLRNGDMTALDQWVSSGKKALVFFKRITSYSYKVRYHMCKRYGANNRDTTPVPHIGFRTFGRRSIYEWTFLEMLERCSVTDYGSLLGMLSLQQYSDDDEIWAYRLIASRGFIETCMASPTALWNRLLNAFDGSDRWVRCLAAFLCAISTSSHRRYCRQAMVNGWCEWMCPQRKYELLRRIYPVFHHPSPHIAMLTYQNRDTGNIKRYALGDFLHMGLLWACIHDDYVTDTYDPCDDENINRAIRLIFTGESLSEHTRQPMPDDYESWMTILNIYTQATDDASSEDDTQERYVDV